MTKSNWPLRMKQVRDVLLCGYILWGLQSGVLSEAWVAIRSWPATGNSVWWLACDRASRDEKQQKGYTRLVCLPDTVDPRRVAAR